MQFQQDWPKDKKLQLFKFLPENRKNYDVPLEGLTIFLYCSYLGHMSLESRRLAEWKYAMFSRTGRKTNKKLPCSKLQEGSTILLQYSAITRTPLESS